MQPLPQPFPPGPGGSCPNGYSRSGSFYVPRQGAPDAIPLPSSGVCPAVDTEWFVLRPPAEITGSTRSTRPRRWASSPLEARRRAPANAVMPSILPEARFLSSFRLPAGSDVMTALAAHIDSKGVIAVPDLALKNQRLKITQRGAHRLEALANAMLVKTEP